MTLDISARRLLTEMGMRLSGLCCRSVHVSFECRETIAWRASADVPGGVTGVVPRRESAQDGKHEEVMFLDRLLISISLHSRT